MHPAALIPHRTGWQLAQELLSRTRVDDEDREVIELADGSQKIQAPRRPSATAYGGFRCERESSSVITVGPGWIHWGPYSWFSRGGRLTIFQRTGITGKIRIAIATTATSTDAISFTYPVDVAISTAREDFEFYTGAGSPEADPGTTEGVEYDWFFYLANVVDGNLTSDGAYPFIEGDPRPYPG